MDRSALAGPIVARPDRPDDLGARWLVAHAVLGSLMREPVFVPGALPRLAFYVALAIVAAWAYPHVYAFFDFILWGR